MHKRRIVLNKDQSFKKGMVEMVLVIMGGIVASALLLGYTIDWKRSRNNNHPHRTINSHAKQGESSNYLMGDHRDHGGHQ